MDQSRRPGGLQASHPGLSRPWLVVRDLPGMSGAGRRTAGGPAELAEGRKTDDEGLEGPRGGVEASPAGQAGGGRPLGDVQGQGQHEEPAQGPAGREGDLPHGGGVGPAAQGQDCEQGEAAVEQDEPPSCGGLESCRAILHWPSDYALGDGAPWVAGATVAAGTQTTIRVPPSGPTGDSARTPPPMAVASSATMVRPSPVPERREPARSDVKWGSKTRGRSPGEIPGPSSSTQTITWPASVRAPSAMEDRANRKAFSKRFERTWSSRSGSVTAQSGSPKGRTRLSSIEAAAASGRKRSRARSTTSRTST